MGNLPNAYSSGGVTLTDRLVSATSAGNPYFDYNGDGVADVTNAWTQE